MNIENKITRWCFLLFFAAGLVSAQNVQEISDVLSAKDDTHVKAWISSLAYDAVSSITIKGDQSNEGKSYVKYYNEIRPKLAVITLETGVSWNRVEDFINTDQDDLSLVQMIIIHWDGKSPFQTSRSEIENVINRLPSLQFFLIRSYQYETAKSAEEVERAFASLVQADTGAEAERDIQILYEVLDQPR